MALQIVVTTDRLSRDPVSRELIGYLEREQTNLAIQNGVLYYDFPAYVNYETNTTRPDLLLFSPRHGFVSIRVLDESLFSRSHEVISELDAALADFNSHLYSRIIRSKALRRTQTRAILEIYPVIFDATGRKLAAAVADCDSEICNSLEGLAALLKRLECPPIAVEACAEVRSVVEGAKALFRAQKRVISDPRTQPLAVAMAAIEAEIANFDQKQRHIALVDVGGPARIRGLAGSGKTVILAMKAAHLHLLNPSATILITFYTRSLRSTIKNLITKFYRHYSESDPDWKLIHIRHGWGSAVLPGVYSDTSRRQGLAPLSFTEANRLATPTKNAFDAVCGKLIKETRIEPFYDHVLIDEGQDFPASFYELCFHLAKGERDRKSIVWAYDELQDILNVKVRQPEELFGKDGDGQPRVSLDRTSSAVPPGATNDAVLSKCYRNQRDVLVAAHALGFGVYGTIVQMLESEAHWQDVGYEVESGPLQTGKPVSVLRPDRNSPLPIPPIDGLPLIAWNPATSLDDEASWVTEQIKQFRDGGLEPEEMVVIALDDRNARTYFRVLSEKLASIDIATNNIIADPYNEPPFAIAGRVTLSTVYRAKGNEAAVVFAMGVDGIETRTRSGRNKLFTAFTRPKAWLRISGIGLPAQKIFAELKDAVERSPRIQFEMPDLQKIETIQRGFSKKQEKAKAARDRYIKDLKAAGYSDDEIEEELAAGTKNE